MNTYFEDHPQTTASIILAYSNFMAEISQYCSRWLLNPLVQCHISIPPENVEKLIDCRKTSLVQMYIQNTFKYLRWSFLQK